MLQTEFVRNLNCNYERILLDRQPDENRYQYCITGRGGIKGLLPSSLRYINGQAYLYYDITSTQNVVQLYADRNITRSWMKDFLWSMNQVKLELGRFLLDDRNVVWHPEQIFQDLEKNNFYFMYIPYYEGECGFLRLIEFWVDHIDYEDETLVNFVYKTHEQFELLGSIYLQEQIFEDAVVLERDMLVMPKDIGLVQQENAVSEEIPQNIPETAKTVLDTPKDEKINRKGLRYLLEAKRRKQREERLAYGRENQQMMAGYAVCEEPVYETEDYGRTIYIEEASASEEQKHRLFTSDGHVAAELNKTPFVIGKKKEETDLCLSDGSVSRVHVRITEENGKRYLEDMNSTNGTYKNGLRLQPYEKRILEPEDEIRLGKVVLIYR